MQCRMALIVFIKTSKWRHIKRSVRGENLQNVHLFLKIIKKLKMFLDNFSCIVFIANISILYELLQKQSVKQVIPILTIYVSKKLCWWCIFSK